MGERLTEARGALLFLLLPLCAGCPVDSSVTAPGGRCPNADARIPSDVPPDNRCEWLDFTRPPDGFPEAIAWVAALSVDGSPSTVEIDYIRLHACISGRDSLLWTTDFNPPATGVCGDTWKRVPWFNAGGPGESDLPYTLDPAGYVVLAPNIRADLVFHLWNCGWPRVDVPAEASGVWAEVRARITGKAAVQAGYDFWEPPPISRNKQGGQSNWYFAAPEWRVIRVGAPCP